MSLQTHHDTKSIIYIDVLIVIMDDRAINNNDGNAEKKPMNIFKRIESWVKTNVVPQQPPQPDPNLGKLYELIDHARTLKRAGQYDDVLAELDRILLLTEDPKLIMSIRLNQTDILTYKKDFPKATAILEDLEKQPALTDEYHAHIANKWGLLWKAQDQWDEAQERFEEAIDYAKRANRGNVVCLATSHLAHIYLKQGNVTYALHLMEETFPLLQLNTEADIVSFFTGIYGLATVGAGRPNGRQILEHALKLAKTSEHNEYQLLWLNSLAMESMKSNLFDEARDYLLEVLEKTDPNTTDYIQALCHLSRVSYYLNAQDALNYAQQAHSILTETHPTDLKMQVHIALGIAYRIHGDGSLALSHLRMIDEETYRTRDHSPAEYGYVDYLRNLAAAYIMVNDLEQSEQIYARALADDTGFDALEKANIQRDKGIYHVYLRQYQEAIHLWTTALKQYEMQRLYVQVARLYCDIGNIRRLMGQGRRAFKDYEQALMVLSSFDDPETRGIVLSNAATIYTDFGDITTAESFFVEAIQISQQLRHAKTETVRRGNYGWFLLHTGRAESALHMLQHAVIQSQSLNMPLHTAVQIDNIGLAWHELRDYEKAITHHKQAWELLQTQTGIDVYWRGIVGANLAHALISANQFDSVGELIENALKIGRDINRQELVVRALNAKIRLLLLQAEPIEDLLLFAEETVSLAHLQGRRRLLADALILRYQVYQRIGRDAEAEQDWEAAKTLLRLLRLKPADYQPTTER